MNDPLLRRYYGSISNVRGYLRSKMFDAIEDEIGADFWDIQNEYYDLKLEDPKGATAFYKKNKAKFSRYYELKDFYEASIGKEMADVSKYLGEKPYPALQKSQPANLSSGQQKVRELIEQPQLPEHYQWDWEDWQGVLSGPLQKVLEDHFEQGYDLPDAAMSALERVAGPLDDDPETILALIGQQLGR
jgi:hypothetical protein